MCRRIKTYIESVVGPATKLQVAILIIERKPCDVNLTGRFEYSCRNGIKYYVASHITKKNFPILCIPGGI